MKHKVRHQVGLLLLAAVFGPCAAYGASTYSIVGITTPSGSAAPTAISAVGAVALWSMTNNVGSPNRGFIWQGGMEQEIPTLPARDTILTGINRDGCVVGITYDVNRLPHGFTWDPNQGLAFPIAPDTTSSYLRGINNQSQVIGYMADMASGKEDAFVWDQTNGVTVLGRLGNGMADANAINDLGQIVGSSGNTTDTAYPIDPNATIGFEHAVLWDHGSVIDLTPTTAWSGASDINSYGQVVGYRMRTIPNGKGVAPNFLSTPFLWDSAHSEVDLPLLGNESGAVAINDAGQIVGYSGTGDADARALLWQGGQVYDLNTLLPPDSGWLLQYATDINNLGQIVGRGLFNGQPAAFLLTPDGPSAAVPEPTACALAGLATIGTILRRRRRHPVHAA